MITSASTQTKAHDDSRLSPNQTSQFRSILFGAACAALIGQSVLLLSSPVTTSVGSDIAGVTFLILAGTYAGSLKTWWRWFAPVSLLLLFAPVAHLESQLGYSVGGLMRASLIPGLAFIGGALIVTLSASRHKSDEASAELQMLRERNLRMLSELRRLEIKMSEIAAGVETPKPQTAVRWEMPSTIEIEESPVLTHQALDQSVTRVLASMRERMAATPKIRFVYSPMTEMPMPLAIRGSQEDFENVFISFLEQAAQSLGGNEGLIRVSVRATPHVVNLLIEDNGRGFSDEILAKLELRGLTHSHSRLSRNEVRSLCDTFGWKVDRHARLGVGTRMALELPRVDAFAQSVRPRPSLTAISNQSLS